MAERSATSARSRKGLRSRLTNGPTAPRPPPSHGQCSDNVSTIDQQPFTADPREGVAPNGSPRDGTALAPGTPAPHAVPFDRPAGTGVRTSQPLLDVIGEHERVPFSTCIRWLTGLAVGL